MSTITLHGVGEDVDSLIRKRAQREGASINRTVKRLLRKALGVEAGTADHRSDFSDIFGSWSKKDISEFECETAGFRKVDAGDWK